MAPGSKAFEPGEQKSEFLWRKAATVFNNRALIHLETHVGHYLAVLLIRLGSWYSANPLAFLPALLTFAAGFLGPGVVVSPSVESTFKKKICFWWCTVGPSGVGKTPVAQGMALVARLAEYLFYQCCTLKTLEEEAGRAGRSSGRKLRSSAGNPPALKKAKTTTPKETSVRDDPAVRDTDPNLLSMQCGEVRRCWAIKQQAVHALRSCLTHRITIEHSDTIRKPFFVFSDQQGRPLHQAAASRRQLCHHNRRRRV